MERIKTDLLVIGAGSGGLSVAAGASQMGAEVVLLEGHKMGGDCLNYGCVPSKALIAAQIGTVPEVLSRTFRRLEGEGILETSADRVRILDHDRFLALAEPIEE